MRESQRKHHPAIAGAPPAVGEMPEEHLEADVDSRAVHDRHVHGEPSRAFDAAVQQPTDDARIVGHALDNAVIEHGETGDFERPPCGRLREGRLGVTDLMCSEEVTRP